MKKFLFLLLGFPLLSYSQKLPTIEEKVKDLKKYEGFLNVAAQNLAKSPFRLIQSLCKYQFIKALPGKLAQNRANWL